MMLFDMATRRRVELPEGSAPLYSPTGHLLYTQGWDPVSLWAAPFSLSGRRIEGEPFMVARNAWQPSLAEDGTLSFLEWAPNSSQLVWRDRDGKKLEAIGAGDAPRISPDGSLIAFALDGNIWLHHVRRGGRTPVTSGQAGDFRPVWSRDGKRLVFASLRGDEVDLWMAELDRMGEEPNRILSSPGLQVPDDWSPDGKSLTYHGAVPGAKFALGFLTFDASTRSWNPKLFGRANDNSTAPNAPMLSPDGRFVAYFSYLSGRAEIYVERFPEGGGRTTVSSNEGRVPRWSASGKELFYLGGGDDSGSPTGLFSVPVSTEPEFSAGRPERLFDVSSHQLLYDVSADDRRFLFSEPPEETTDTAIWIVQNWYEEFRGREN